MSSEDDDDIADDVTDADGALVALRTTKSTSAYNLLWSYGIKHN